MIVHVCERAAEAATISRVVVATDDTRIADVVTSFGYEATLTSAAHETGTDRIAEVAESIDADLVVNVQGDEPMLAPSTIDAAVRALVSAPSSVASTTCEPLGSREEFLNPNVVKVTTRLDGRALYFSRAPIPFPRDAGSGSDVSTTSLAVPDRCRKHTGLYVYRRSFLLEFMRMSPTPLERLERLEQLRILESGYDLLVVEVSERSIAVDTPDDLARVRDAWDEWVAKRKEPN
jgi:3-deoxy-manno-octulosonate cytidylyltransferase (CMP-KDO synthetase)